MEYKGKTRGQLTKGEARFRKEYNVLAAINRVFREALTCQTEEQLAKTSLHVAEELTGSKFGFIGEVNQAGRFDTIAMSDPGWAECRVSGSEATRLITNMEVRGIWGRVLKDEKPLITNDPASYSDSIGTPEGHPQITSFLGVPLKEADRTFGMIALANKKGGYERADQEAVEALSIAIVEALMRFRAEQAQRRSEERHRDLVETAPEVFFSISPEDGTLTSLNLAFEQITGWLRSEIVGKPLTSIIHHDDIPIALEKFAKALQGETSPPYELRFMSKSGKILVGEVVGKPRAEDGKVVEVFGFVRDITERKQSEKKYTTIIETALDGFWIVDLKGRFLDVNDSYCQMIGYTREELLTMSIPDIEAAEKPEETAQRIKRIIEQGYDRFETRHRRKDGKIINLEISTKYSDVEGGQLVVFVRNITEHKQAEELLMTLANSSPIGLYIVQDGEFQYINPRFQQLMGYGNELLGRPALSFVFAEDREMVRENAVKMLKSQRFSPYEYRYVNKQGEAKWVLERVASILYQGKRATLGSFIDITERKRAEEALRQSEEKLRVMFQSVAEGITIIDLEGNVLEMNEAALRMGGYSKEEAIGRSTVELTSPEERAKAMENMKRLMTERLPETMEYAFLRKDGTKFPGEVNTCLIRDASGNPAGFITVTRDITERKRAEEVLRESEERYKAIFEFTREAVIVSGPHGRILSANPAAAAILGYDSPQELLDIFAIELYADQGRRKALQTELMKKGYVEDMEVVLRKKDGTPVHVLGSTTIHRDQQGKMVRAESIWMDITERKKAEKERLELEARYATVVEQAIDGIVIIQDGVVKFANKAVMDMMGYTPEETFGKLPFDLMPAEDQEKAKQRLAERRVGDQISDLLTLRIRHKDGTFRHLESSGTVIQYEGHPALLVFARDVTKRKKAEEALKQSEEKYRSLVTNIPDVVWTANLQGDLIFMSPNVEAVTGYTPEEMCRGGYLMLLENTHPDDVKMIMERLGPQVERGAPIDVEYRLRRKDGEWVWLHTRTTAAYEKDGTNYTDGVSTDITGRKRMETQLKEYSENLERMVEKRSQELKDAQEKLVRTEKLAAIGQLAGGVGHELRSPLAAINTSAYFLKMKLGNTAEEKVVNHLNMLEKQVGVCDKIITDLLDFSRPGKTNIVEIDMNQAIQGMVKAIGTPANVKISLSLATDLPKVMADRGQLERVFSNLISNAIQAMPHGGSLSFSTNQSEDFIEVKVADTGEGIAQENLDKIFEPLFTTKAKGTGLGLSIARALVERQGGTIKVESQVGQGTTFAIRLPVIGRRGNGNGKNNYYGG